MRLSITNAQRNLRSKDIRYQDLRSAFETLWCFAVQEPRWDNIVCEKFDKIVSEALSLRAFSFIHGFFNLNYTLIEVLWEVDASHLIISVVEKLEVIFAFWHPFHVIENINNISFKRDLILSSIVTYRSNY